MRIAGSGWRRINDWEASGEAGPHVVLLDLSVPLDLVRAQLLRLCGRGGIISGWEVERPKLSCELARALLCGRSIPD